MTQPAKGSLGICAAEGTFQHWSQQQTIKAGKAEPEELPPPRYAKLLAEFPGIDKTDFTKKPLATHTIDTADSKPCRSAVRHINETIGLVEPPPHSLPTEVDNLPAGALRHSTGR